METGATACYWLLKAEPESRTVKGKDVKFSVDDFETAKISPWEGVRNYEARNLLKSMKVGEKALFYHSNCKSPGIAAFAEVAKEAYPDHTAWDPSHPYYDPKSKQDDPKWFMVDLSFGSRTKHFIPLALLRFIADSEATTPPAGLEYLGEDGVAAIKGMDLVTRGRLSVQRVSEAAWTAMQQLASTGGWDDLDLAPKKKVSKKAPAERSAASHPRAAKAKAKARKRKAKGSDSEDDDDEDYDSGEVISKTTSSRRKRKAEDYQELPSTRRASRVKTGD